MKVSLIEAIRNVPAKWAKLPSLLNERVEEAQAIQELFPDLKADAVELVSEKNPYAWTYN